MKHPALCCAVTALLLPGAPSAHAQDAYWYAGLGSGYSRVQFYSADFSSRGAITGCNPCADSKKEFDAGFKGFVGYQINRNWAAEVGYVTVGKFHYFYNNGNVTQDATYKVTGVGFSAIPTVPFTRNFSLYGRFGAFFSQTRLTLYNSGFVAGVSSDGRQVSETSFLTGFGAQYFFAGDNGIRIEYENFGTVGDCSVLPCVGRANAKMASVNLIFKF
jgi:OmpA-OmpF porin, OOP family